MDVFDAGRGVEDRLGGFGVKGPDLGLVETGREVGDAASSGVIAAGSPPVGVGLVDRFGQELGFPAEEGPLEPHGPQDLGPFVHGLKIPFRRLLGQIGPERFGHEELEKAREGRRVFGVEVVLPAPDAVVGQLVAAAFHHGTAQIHVGKARLGGGFGHTFESFRRHEPVVGTAPRKEDDPFVIRFHCRCPFLLFCGGNITPERNNVKR